MIIVSNKDEIDNLYNKLKSSDSFFLIVPENPFDNSPHGNISLVFIYLVQYSEEYCIVNTHPDFDLVVDLHVFFNKIETRRFIFVYNKKLFNYFFRAKNIELNSIFIDVNFAKYICDNTSFQHNELENLTNVYRKFISKYRNNPVNGIVPIPSHYEYFQILVNEFKKLYEDNKDFLNECKKLLIVLDEYYTNSFNRFEINGIQVESDNIKKLNKNLYIKDSKIFCNYEFFTRTGRPTNTYSKLNLLALDKKNGVRKFFVSRFKEEGGILYQFDYSSFHLKLISLLIDEWNIDITNLHKYLGNKINPLIDLEDDDNYQNMKGLIFKQIYGGVSKEYLHIDFFKKLNIFTDSLWDDFNRRGYIETKVFGKKIFKKWFLKEGINKFQLVNYYLQSFESEFCSFIIKDINDYIERNCLESKLILYTYDSFLFDMKNSELPTHFNQIKKIITYNETIPVVIKSGKNYQDLFLSINI